MKMKPATVPGKYAVLKSYRNNDVTASKGNPPLLVEKLMERGATNFDEDTTPAICATLHYSSFKNIPFQPDVLFASDYLFIVLDPTVQARLENFQGFIPPMCTVSVDGWISHLVCEKTVLVPISKSDS